MVTTRGRIGDKLTEEELNDDDTITVYVPSSPKKRKQATKSSQSADIINQTITTPIAKKQKVAAHDDDGQNSNTCIVVEIPAKNKASLEDKQKVEILEEGSNKSSTSKTLNPEAPKGDRGTSSKKHRNGIAQLDGPWDEDREYTDDEDHVYMKTPEKIKQDLSALEAGSRKPVYAPGIIRHKSGRDTIDMSQSYASNSDDERFNSTQATASLSATKTKQQRFGNNEPEKEIVSTASQQIEQNEESSGDDAPEEMTAQVRDKGKGVATAPVQQKSPSQSQHKKTKATLKKCPEAVKKHHNWAEGVERMSERGMAKSRLFNDVSSSRLGLDRAADDGESCCGAIAEKHHETEDQDIFQLEDTTPLSHSTANISRLPTVLPAEYLEDSRVNAIGTFGPQLRVKKGKKTKFADIVDKNFKDRKKGSTTYRVGEDRTTSLAPKVSLQAKATKEAWLQGRNGSNRKPFSSGFLK